MIHQSRRVVDIRIESDDPIAVFAENDGHPMLRLEQRQSATHIHLDWLQAESICDQLSKLLAAREDQSDKFIKRYLERNGQL